MHYRWNQICLNKSKFAPMETQNVWLSITHQHYYQRCYHYNSFHSVRFDVLCKALGPENAAVQGGGGED